MKIGIIAFCDTKFNLQTECLFPENWDNLTDMYKFLKLFYNIIMVIQSVFDAIDKIFLTMDYLFTHFKNKYYNYVHGSFMAA